MVPFSAVPEDENKTGSPFRHSEVNLTPFPPNCPRYCMLRLVPLILLLCAAPSLSLAQSREPSTSHTAPASVVTLVEKGRYINREGFDVHRPAHTSTGAIPSGATAQCRDGSFSFSMSRRGTCSHHGGVARWL
jgi:hypothetical protein